MPAKLKHPKQYKRLEDLPEYRITPGMIFDSYLSISPQIVRAGVRSGKWRGYEVGNRVYMNREQVRQNWEV